MTRTPAAAFAGLVGLEGEAPAAAALNRAALMAAVTSHESLTTAEAAAKKAACDGPAASASICSKGDPSLVHHQISPCAHPTRLLGKGCVGGSVILVKDTGLPNLCAAIHCHTNIYLILWSVTQSPSYLQGRSGGLNEQPVSERLSPHSQLESRSCAPTRTEICAANNPRALAAVVTVTAL